MPQCSEETWDKIFDVNVKSAFLLTQLVVPEMDKRPGGGSIVFVSSVAGFQPMPVSLVYHPNADVLRMY